MAAFWMILSHEGRDPTEPSSLPGSPQALSLQPETGLGEPSAPAPPGKALGLEEPAIIPDV